MKILLAIDGSDYSRVAVDELTRLPFPSNTEVRIISVFEYALLAAPGPVPMGGLPENYEETIAITRQSAEDRVKKAAKMLKKKNVELSIVTKVMDGLPKNVILEEAEEFGADLIVVGSQGHGAFTRFLLGSVSQSVAAHANCSVLIVRKPDSEMKK